MDRNGIASNPKKGATAVDLEKQPTSTREVQEPPQLQHTQSHVSYHDMPAPIVDVDDQDEVYNKFSHGRKNLMVCILCLCSFLAPISSTSVLAAVPEVADTYQTSGSIINLSNAMYMLFMGFSPIFWGPLSTIYGRRFNCIVSGVLFFAFSIGTALALDLASFFIFRMLTAFQGTAFLIIGSACIGDIYKPTERATALGWFLSGTLIGPAFGPFIAGIIVTFRSWRDIFWLQTALAGLALVLVILFLPETIHYRRAEELQGLTRKQYAHKLWQWSNPIRVIRLFRYPNLLTTSLASSALVWNMYSLLTPIRYVLNPRFHLTSPLQGALFYIAPGCGYLLGTLIGGRWADYTVKKWIKIKGHRVAEDRLRSAVPFMGVAIPGCMIIYGWSVEKAVGGVPLPVIMMFLQGVAQLFCFPSLNTYCLDVMKGRSSEVIGGNYLIRYIFAALGSALCLPAVEKIGVGWFSTISAVFLILSTVSVYFTTLYGESWRNKVDARKAEKKERKSQREVPQEV